MSNPIKLLTRLFNRDSSNQVVTELYAKAMNQPLFVHPGMGEMVIQGYLHSDINQMKGDVGRRGENQVEATVGVLDISGALVARETPGPCGSGPLSYEEIKTDFDMLLADPAIKTIIGRFDTPGGMAAQNMDLSDHIYGSRGQGTKLIAMVDDMAYSAGFALASAFDEVWITRTGGVGSVGVVSYHVNQSEFNDKMGIKIEYIYAGNQKIDGNPHEALSAEAKSRFQGEVSRLYNIFTATTARNLGLSVDAVKATEAGTFHGERAVEAGFAHKLGTFSDLLQSLIPQGDSSVAVVTMEDQSGDDIALVKEGSMAVDAIMQLSMSDDAGDEGTGMGDDEAGSEGDGDDESAEQKEQEQTAQTAAEIKAICAAAKVPEVAADYIKSGVSVEQVRKDLFDMLTTGDTEINNSAASPVIVAENQAKSVNSHDIYAQRKQANRR